MLLRRVGGRTVVAAAPEAGAPHGGPSGQWIGAALLLACGSQLLGPIAQTLLGETAFQSVSAAGPQAAAANLIQLIGEVLVLASAVLCLVAANSTQLASSWVPRIAPVIALSLPVAYGVLRSRFANSYPGLFSASVLIAIAVVCATGAVQQHFGAVTAHFAWLSATASLSLALLIPGQTFLRYRDGTAVTADKAILPGDLLQGIFAHPNTLGQLLAMTFPALCAFLTSWKRAAAIGGVLLCLLWSADRTAMLAVALAAICLVVGRVRGARALTRLVVPITITAFALTIVLPLTTTDPIAYSGRGQIWLGSLSYWSSNVWFGLGMNWYSSVAQYANDLIPQAFHGHNQFVTWGAEGGVALLLLMLVILGLALIGAVRVVHASGTQWWLVTFQSLAVLGIFEAPTDLSAPGQLTIVSWTVVACLVSFCWADLRPRDGVTGAIS